MAAPVTVTEFADFYRREYPGSVRLAFLLTRSPEPAEDLTQEAFAVVHARWPGLRNPGGYLRVVLVNRCRRWHRANGREERRLRLVHAVADPVPEPEYLLDALAGLPFRQRTVLVLRYWAGLSEAEIAEALGCRPGTVKSLASRALSRLRTEVPHA
ncbi:MAG: RNA polymerase sigma factor [Acidimicrobiia bacterium]